MRASAFHDRSAAGEKNKKMKLTATMVAVFICGLGPTLLTMDVWIDDRHWPFLLPAGPRRPGLPVQPELSSA